MADSVRPSASRDQLQTLKKTAKPVSRSDDSRALHRCRPVNPGSRCRELRREGQGF